MAVLSGLKDLQTASWCWLIRGESNSPVVRCRLSLASDKSPSEVKEICPLKLQSQNRANEVSHNPGSQKQVVAQENPINPIGYNIYI